MNPADPRAKALVGKKVRLPIVGRLIPIIADEHVVLPNPDSEDEKARFSTGFLKVTPAHDPDDWEIGQRHDLAGHQRHGPRRLDQRQARLDRRDRSPRPRTSSGMDRFEAREAIVEWFRKEKSARRSPRLPPRSRPQLPQPCADRAVPVRPVVCRRQETDRAPGREGRHRTDRRHGCARQLAGGPGPEAAARWPAAFHSRTLCQDLSGLAGKPARLAHQPPALVGTSDSGVVEGRRAEDRLRQRRPPIRILRRRSGHVRLRGSGERSGREDRWRRTAGNAIRTCSTRGSARPCGRSARWAGRRRRPR